MNPEFNGEDTYDTVVRVLANVFQYDLTPAEAIDYIAVDKAGRKTGDWAAVRGVRSQSVSGNLGSAREKINAQRLDADVVEEDDRVLVRVEGHDGEMHELQFSKTTTVLTHDNDAQLQLIYEATTAIHGYYVDEDGQEFESTLWFDGQPYNSFEDFDFKDNWGSPEAKADTILWRRFERVPAKD